MRVCDSTWHEPLSHLGDKPRLKTFTRGIAPSEEERADCAVAFCEATHAATR